MLDFDELVNRGEALLVDAVQAEMQEGLSLDFKAPAVGRQGAAFNAQGQPTKEGRATLAKALSAFSNSAGGVLVLGVDCRKNSEGVDCAVALMHVAQKCARFWDSDMHQNKDLKRVA